MTEREGIARAGKVHRKIICPGFSAGEGATQNNTSMIITLLLQNVELGRLATRGRLPITESLVGIIRRSKRDNFLALSIAGLDHNIGAYLICLEERGTYWFELVIPIVVGTFR